MSRVGLTRKDLEELSWIIGVCHDYGKATMFFQKYLFEEDEEKRASLKNKPETNHAHLSSLFTYQQLKNRFNKTKSPLAEIIPYLGYEVVRRHHGNLKDMNDEILGKGRVASDRELEVFRKQIEETDKELLQNVFNGVFPVEELEYFNDHLEEIYTEIKRGRRTLRKNRDNGVEASVLTLFCFSVLISMDKEDASGLSVDRDYDSLPPYLIEEYCKNMGYDKPVSELNKIRNEIYLKAKEKANALDLDRRVLSLNMPTGSGKTLTGLNFALLLRDRLRKELDIYARIIYSVSFISIIDQNSSVFEEAYKSVMCEEASTGTLLKHHHLADVLYDSGEDEYEYDRLESQFFVEGWNSEIIFTTFVQFFHSVLTNRNRALRKLHRIANSIILLDEVQSIPYKYWPLLRRYLNIFSEFFHTYFIFMTATMPYIFPEDEITEIIDDPGQYYGFFDRVDLFPSLAELELSDYLSMVTCEIRENPCKRYLLIHNTVKSSQQVFRHLRDRLPTLRHVYLSTMVTPKERLRRIDRIKDDTPVVVVSTQLVEAGVDIDMDVVYRDMAPLDSVIQASGRCNRNFGDTRGRVHLVKLVDERPFFSYIYGASSILVTRTTSVLDKPCFPEGLFRELVDRFYNLVTTGMSRDISREIIGYLEKLSFQSLRDFALIEDDYPKVDVFVEVDEEAEMIWGRYLSLGDIDDWKMRRERFLALRRDFFGHIISV
ncbi:CRISPR-associated helicase Cas3', partial [Candidatus Bathyarchaeota archaeon]|nr:CRISPR-associated helicase Cas3' [Candidatus Bathyarchaeota archaeon]